MALVPQTIVSHGGSESKSCVWPVEQSAATTTAVNWAKTKASVLVDPLGTLCGCSPICAGGYCGDRGGGLVGLRVISRQCFAQVCR